MVGGRSRGPRDPCGRSFARGRRSGICPDHFCLSSSIPLGRRRDVSARAASIRAGEGGNLARRDSARRQRLRSRRKLRAVSEGLGRTGINDAGVASLLEDCPLAEPRISHQLELATLAAHQVHKIHMKRIAQRVARRRCGEQQEVAGADLERLRHACFCTIGTLPAVSSVNIDRHRLASAATALCCSAIAAASYAPALLRDGEAHLSAWRLIRAPLQPPAAPAARPRDRASIRAEHARHRPPRPARRHRARELPHPAREGGSPSVQH